MACGGPPAPARVADAAAREGRRRHQAPRQPPGEGQGGGYDGGVESPGPRGLCMTTLSTQRPNLKPAERSVPTRTKPNDACRLIDAAFALSPITAISWR